MHTRSPLAAIHLPTRFHLSFLLGASSAAHKLHSWLTFILHTRPTQLNAIHMEKQFKQKKWLCLTVTPEGKRWIQRFCVWPRYSFRSSIVAGKFVSLSFCPDSDQCLSWEQPALQSPGIPQHSAGWGYNKPYWFWPLTVPHFSAVALARMDRQSQTTHLPNFLLCFWLLLHITVPFTPLFP